jgi:hypothetical protein
MWKALKSRPSGNGRAVDFRIKKGPSRMIGIERRITPNKTASQGEKPEVNVDS